MIIDICIDTLYIYMYRHTHTIYRYIYIYTYKIVPLSFKRYSIPNVRSLHRCPRGQDPFPQGHQTLDRRVVPRRFGHEEMEVSPEKMVKDVGVMELIFVEDE